MKLLWKQKNKKQERERIPTLETFAVNQESKQERALEEQEQENIIALTKRHRMEAKLEYGAVTEYLTDIQKIERIPIEAKEELEEVARRLVRLKEERMQFQTQEESISIERYRQCEQLEEIIPVQLVTMKDSETYEELIQSDMHKLEVEKERLRQEREAILRRQTDLRYIGLFTAIAMAILFLVFLWMERRYPIDITIPALIAVSCAIVVTFLVFVENHSNVRERYTLDRRIQKITGLLNRVKLKYVHNRNQLEYMYEKYGVQSSKELAAIWAAYKKRKEETRRYYANTDLIERYQTVIIQELQSYDVRDAEVWIYQASALFDPKEMVEVRHRLNLRRQRLREQIKYQDELLKQANVWYVEEE